MTRGFTCTAIATLAVISALALSAGPASAAVTSAEAAGGTQSLLALTREECSSIRAEIAFLWAEREGYQAELPTATPSQKADLMREIKRLFDEIQILSAKHDAGCLLYGTPLPA
jgi:hypothetical protein